MVATAAHPFLSFEPFPHQRLFLDRALRQRKKQTWLIAANRSGKSEVGAYTTVCAALGVCPAIPMWRGKVPAEVACVALDFPMSRDVSLEKIYKFLPSEEVLRYRRDERKIYLRNGSTIALRSCDSGREKFQGVAWDYVWCDEEPPEDIHSEIMTRLIDRGGTLIGTMTPLNGSVWLHKRVYTANDPSIAVVGATMRDNLALDPTEIAAIESRYPSEEERLVRVEGKFILFSGRPAFNVLRLMDLLTTCEDPKWVGDFPEKKSSAGDLRIIEIDRPRPDED